MRVLVTGGAGFIGSHLCERLLAYGDEVICVDDLSTGRRDNVAHLGAERGFTLVEHDVVTPFVADVERIYSLACPASPRAYRRMPVKTLTTSVLGTMHALALAAQSGARLLVASTSEVYGDPAVHPQSEDYLGNVDCTGPRACYVEGKRAAEALCFAYRAEHGVDVRVARIFNTHGPRLREDDGRVVSSFVVAALSGAPLVVYGDGAQSRSFCYVDDLVDGLVAMMERYDGPGPLNLGNPEEVSVIALAREVLRLTGSPSRLEHAPAPKDDPKRRRPDITRAQGHLGFAPKVGLEAGLLRTIDDLRRRLR